MAERQADDHNDDIETGCRQVEQTVQKHHMPEVEQADNDRFHPVNQHQKTNMDTSKNGFFGPV